MKLFTQIKRAICGKPSDKFRFRDWKTGVIMIIPAFAILFTFGTVPLIMAVIRSFQDYSTGLFVGFQNFRLILSDTVFTKSFGNVFLIGGCCVVLMIVLSFLFASLIIKLPDRVGGAVKILIYVPCVLSGVVTAIIYTFLMNYGGGLFTSILLSLGLEPISFAKEGIWPYVSIIVPTLWGGIGLNTLIMIAAILQIPKSYYEAARLDGANRFHLMWHITLPGIRNYLVLMLVNLVTGYMQMLDLPYLITAGGPDNKTMVPALYLFMSFRDSARTPNITIAGALLIMILLVAVNAVVFVLIRSKKSEAD